MPGSRLAQRMSTERRIPTFSATLPIVPIPNDLQQLASPQPMTPTEKPTEVKWNSTASMPSVPHHAQCVGWKG